MKIRGILALAVLLMMQTCRAQGEDMPAAPSTASEAEAAGLPRVGSSELGQHYGGTRLLITDKGQVVRLRLHADGSLEYLDDSGAADTGNWLVQPRKGGTLCRSYSKQMGGRTCVIYFAAADGVHWFGYGADDGRWRDTTRSLDDR
jgi:hypothetical protein